MSGRVRRDRHGRGLRGPLAPPSSPATVARLDRFGDLVADAVDRLEPSWGQHLRAVDVEVADAPPVDPEMSEPPLAGHRLSADGREATVVVFRRPVLLRAPERPALVDLVRDLVAEQLADALGLDPADLDPGYDRP